MKNIIKIIFISIFIFFIFDVTLGNYIYKKFIKVKLADVKTSYSLKDPLYDHKLPKNYNDLAGFGNRRYQLCTDDNGFRNFCDYKKNNQKKFDIGFMGDSFTEGIGIEYENTYIGIIKKKLNSYENANLATVSYSPSIYYSKIKSLLESGYTFKKIIVFIDLSDFPDETLCYNLEFNKVERRSTFEKYCFKNSYENKIIFWLKKKFNFTRLLFEQFKYQLVNLGILKNKVDKHIIKHSRSEWTFNFKKENFNNFSKTDALNLYTKNMFRLSISLSVAVYPWPGTLYFDERDNWQVKIWQKFCQTECKNFYNLMNIFYDKLEKNEFYNVYNDYFIFGDIHFNEKGNRLIADTFLKKFLDNKK